MFVALLKPHIFLADCRLLQYILVYKLQSFKNYQCVATKYNSFNANIGVLLTV
jgi:hypothetical protein